LIFFRLSLYVEYTISTNNKTEQICVYIVHSNGDKLISNHNRSLNKLFVFLKMIKITKNTAKMHKLKNRKKPKCQVWSLPVLEFAFLSRNDILLFIETIS